MVVIDYRHLSIILIFTASTPSVEVEHIITLLPILTHFNLRIIHHHLIFYTDIGVCRQQLQIIIIASTPTLRQALQSRRRLVIIHRILVQKSVLHHVWILDVQHGVLQQNVVFSEVLARAHFVILVCGLRLLIIVILVLGLDTRIIV